MTLSRSLVAVTALFAAACSSGQLHEQRPPEVSPGTVTLRLLLSPTQTYCDVTDGCGGKQHIFIATQPGTLPEMPTGPSYQGPVCAPQCGDAHQCLPAGPCPGYATCLPTGPVGVGVTSVETTWNGSYVEWASCGDGIACYDPRFVVPGRYLARLCVTPGTLTVTDSLSPPTCTPTGAEECVDAAFDLPGPALVEVPLPPTAGG